MKEMKRNKINFTELKKKTINQIVFTYFNLHMILLRMSFMDKDFFFSIEN